MTLYTTVMDISETLEAIEGAPDQLEALRAYNSLGSYLGNFIRWYANTDYSSLSSELEYVPLDNHRQMLITKQTDLDCLASYPRNKQIVILNRVMAIVTDKAMMLMENCLDRNLTGYFPGIDWEMVADFYSVKL